MTPDEAVAKAAGLPCWNGPVTPRPIEGGITNLNFRVDDGRDSFLVRVGGNIPVHGIRRTYETACSRAAHAAGIAPGVHFTAKGVLVVRWIDGHTFGDADVRDPRNLERIADLLARLHREGALHLRGRAPFFWVFHVIRDYGHRLHDDRHRLLAEVPQLLVAAQDLEAAVGPISPVLCHNDLLAANFLDDGERLWLVDWEYAGYNTALFDIANLASNSHLDAGDRENVAELVLGQPVTDEVRWRLGALACASLLREAMWSMVQETHSSLDVDYVAYTADYLDRFNGALAAWRRNG